MDAQIAKLREIDGTIRPEDRPEWFTTEWIDQAEREMKAPSDNTGTALDAALSGQYAAFENAVIGYIARTTRTREPARTARASSPDTRWPHATRTERPWPTGSTGSTMKDGPRGAGGTETELRSLREGIFDSPDSWDSFNTATDTPDTTAADTSGRRHEART